MLDFFEDVERALARAQGWAVLERLVFTTLSVNVALPSEPDAPPLNLHRLLAHVQGRLCCGFQAKKSHGRYAGALELADAATGRGVKINASRQVQLTGCKHGAAVVDTLTRLARVCAESGDAWVCSGDLDPTSNLIKAKVVIDRRVSLADLDEIVLGASMVPSQKARAPGMTVRPTANIQSACNASLTFHEAGTVFVHSGGGLLGVAQGVEKMVEMLNALAIAGGLVRDEPCARRVKLSGPAVSLRLRHGYLEQTAELAGL